MIAPTDRNSRSACPTVAADSPLRSTIVATDGNAPSLDSASTNLHSTPYRCSDDACSAPLDTWSCTQHGTCTNLVFLTVILAPH
jgi:hypothetical protein